MGDELRMQSLTERNAPEPLRSRDGLVEIVPTHCADCGAELPGEFCARCGQHRVEPPRTFWALMREWVSAYFNLEGKLWTTLRVLVLQPGELSLEYFRGRRTRYFPPLKLYLTMSVLFFSLAALRLYVAGDHTQSKAEVKAQQRAEILEQLEGWDPDFDELQSDDDEVARQVRAMGLTMEKMARSLARARLQALDEDRRLTPEERSKLQQEIDAARVATHSLSKKLPASVQGPTVGLIVDRVAAQLSEQLDQDLERDFAGTPKEKVTRLIEDLASSSPKALFFFLPIFAGVYAFLFRKQSFYVESFVFTLHLHSFFLALGVVDMFVPAWPTTFVMLIGMAVYTGLSLQRVFAVSRARAISATVFASVAYMAIFAILNGLIREASLLSCALGGKCA